MNKFRRFTIAFLLGFPLVVSPLLQTRGYAHRDPPAIGNVGAIMRGQMAYYLDNGEFAGNIADLGLGINLDPTKSFGVPFTLTMQIKNDVVSISSTYEDLFDRCTFYLSDLIPISDWFSYRSN